MSKQHAETDESQNIHGYLGQRDRGTDQRMAGGHWGRLDHKDRHRHDRRGREAAGRKVPLYRGDSLVRTAAELMSARPDALPFAFASPEPRNCPDGRLDPTPRRWLPTGGGDRDPHVARTEVATVSERPEVSLERVLCSPPC